MSQFNVALIPAPSPVGRRDLLPLQAYCDSCAYGRGQSVDSQLFFSLSLRERAGVRASKPMKQFAKNLRTNQTDAEIKIWRHLKKRALAGFKFRRQCPIGPYIVDFVCLEKMVVIEIAVF